MIVLSETGGQTCNHYWQYLYYLKDAIKNDTSFTVQLPDYTIEDYPNLLKSKYIKFPFYSSKLSRIIGVKKSIELTRKFTILFLNNYSRMFLHYLSFKYLNFINGKPAWGLKNVQYSDIASKLQYLFDLEDSLKTPIDKAIMHGASRIVAEKNNHLIICGLHIRGGDYRKWKGGKYFFTQKTYREYCDSFLKLFPNNNVLFYIATNEPLDNEVFKDLNYVQIKTASATQDLYGLSKCDYLIGTLSSYNSWVSLVWQKPLFTITDTTIPQNVKKCDFAIVENYHQKTNGWVFPRTEDFFLKQRHPWLYKHSSSPEYRITEY